jgi:hypothetical protein
MKKEAIHLLWCAADGCPLHLFLIACLSWMLSPMPYHCPGL